MSLILSLNYVHNLFQRMDGDPGFFFYENSEGFNFKSIHSMIVEGNERLQDKRGYAQKLITYVYKGDCC